MKNFALYLGVVIALTACSSNKPVESKDADKGISLSSDKVIVAHNDTISVYEEDSTTWIAKRMACKSAPKKVDSLVAGDSNCYVIVRVAQIPAITVSGKVVQANDVVISGNTALIAYNFAGDDFAGALQIVDISSPDHPVITDELKFGTMDINAVEIDGQKLLFGGQADPDIWGFKSYVGIVDLSTVTIDEIINSIIELPSHATSGICRHGTNYFMSVGAADGKIMKTDLSFGRVDSLSMADVRDVDAYQSGIIAVAGTTDNISTTGKIIIAPDNSFHSPTIIPIVDFDSDYHKATIEVYEGTIALLGLSTAGFQVYNLLSNTKVYELANPDSSAGIETDANSVSSDGKFIFTANGGYGFRVLRPKNNDFAQIEKIGFYHPDVISSADPSLVGYTANHIECKSNYLFVASGAAGVHVYSLKKKI